MRDVAGKAIGLGLVAATCIGGAVLAFYGPHAYNDYPNIWLALGLLASGLAAGGIGGVMILAELQEKRQQRREHELHITPRPGPLGPPPPWGMGDVGRVRGSVKEVGGPPRGGGSQRLMSVTAHNLDAAVVVGLLLLGTLIALVAKAALGGIDIPAGTNP